MDPRQMLEGALRRMRLHLAITSNIQNSKPSNANTATIEPCSTASVSSRAFAVESPTEPQTVVMLCR